MGIKGLTFRVDKSWLRRVPPLFPTQCSSNLILKICNLKEAVCFSKLNKLLMRNNRIYNRSNICVRSQLVLTYHVTVQYAKYPLKFNSINSLLQEKRHVCLLIKSYKRTMKSAHLTQKRLAVYRHFFPRVEKTFEG